MPTRKLGKPSKYRVREKVVNKACIICSVVCDQLCNASHSRGRLLRPGEDPAFSGVWKSYYHYWSAHVKVLNDCIRGVGVFGGMNRAFISIKDLVVFDCYLNGSSWHLHLNGYFAYVEHCGGVQAVLNHPDPPYGSFSAVIA